MMKPRFAETKIVSILNQVDAGMAVKELCRTHGTLFASIDHHTRIKTTCFLNNRNGHLEEP